MGYECYRCNIPVKGGFEPTGFVFDHDERDKYRTLCRPCYEEFWFQHKKLDELKQRFVEEFLEQLKIRKNNAT